LFTAQWRQHFSQCEPTFTEYCGLLNECYFISLRLKIMTTVIYLNTLSE
jgi:hypothetical protein